MFLTQVGSETIGFIKQIKRGQRTGKVGTYHNDRSLGRHELEQLFADFFFAGSDEQNERNFILGVFLALHEIGNGEETSMTDVAIVGRHTGNKSGFGHVAFDIIGYRFTKRSIAHMEMVYLTKCRC